MATNPFFNHFHQPNEQNIIEDIVIEAMKIYGYDLLYIPKYIDNYMDPIYLENPITEYRKAYPIEMYVKSVDGFGGEGDFYSKFNIQIRDEVSLVVARKTFNLEVGRHENLIRPNEGDLIFFPMSNDLFQIRFVEHEQPFYQLGKLYVWELTCQEFEYSNERFRTGIPAIDRIERDNSFNMSIDAILSEEGDIIVSECNYPIISDDFDFEEQLDTFADNDEIQRESDIIINFDEKNPFGDSY